MQQLTIRFAEHSHNVRCVFCGSRFQAAAGPCLALGDGEEPVCRGCARKHAPQLVALVDLAQTAQRVGKVCRYILVPPMESLLDLARAAEEYSNNAAAHVLQHAA